MFTYTYFVPKCYQRDLKMWVKLRTKVFSFNIERENDEDEKFDFHRSRVNQYQGDTKEDIQRERCFEVNTSHKTHESAYLYNKKDFRHQ